MALTPTLYGDIDTGLFDALKHLKLVAFDVDGVFSDGSIYMGNDGEELKAFHALDGYGIKALMKCGVDVAIITGRDSNIVANRMDSLGVKHVYQGQEDKQQTLLGLQQTLKLQKSECASMGDDMPDLGMFAVCHINFGVVSGHPYVNQKAQYITQRQGGSGAVREVCDLILQAKGQLEEIHGASL